MATGEGQTGKGLSDYLSGEWVKRIPEFFPDLSCSHNGQLYKGQKRKTNKTRGLFQHMSLYEKRRDYGLFTRPDEIKVRTSTIPLGERE